MRFAYSHWKGKYESFHQFDVVDAKGQTYWFEKSEYDAIEAWCAAEIHPDGFSRWLVRATGVHIVEDNDALMFRMRWCG